MTAGIAEVAVPALISGALAAGGSMGAAALSSQGESNETMTSSNPINDGSILDQVASTQSTGMDLGSLMGQNRSSLLQSMMAQNSPFRFLG